MHGQNHIKLEGTVFLSHRTCWKWLGLCCI